MASTYLDETSGRRKASLGISPLMLAGIGIAGAYGLGAVDSYAKPTYMGLGGSTTSRTFTLGGVYRHGAAGVANLHASMSMGAERAGFAALKASNWARGVPGRIGGALGSGIRSFTSSVGSAAYSVGGAIGTGLGGAINAAFAAPGAIKNLLTAASNTYFSAYGRARGGALSAVSAARRGVVRAGQAIVRAPAAITDAYFSAYGRARGRVLGAMPKFPAWGETTPAGLRWPGGGGDSAWNSMSSGIFGTPGKIKAGIRAAWNAPLPRPQTIGSMLKRGAINTAKLPLMGVGALGSKAIAMTGMGVAAGLGIWAGASMALLSFMPYSAQGAAVRGTRIMGSAMPTFTASRGPMSPNNLATNGLTQSLFNTRHGQH